MTITKLATGPRMATTESDRITGRDAASPLPNADSGMPGCDVLLDCGRAQNSRIWTARRALSWSRVRRIYAAIAASSGAFRMLGS